MEMLFRFYNLNSLHKLPDSICHGLDGAPNLRHEKRRF